METLILTVDTVALLVAIWFSWKNDLLRPGSTENGPFRVKPPREPAAPPPKRRVRRL